MLLPADLLSTTLMPWAMASVVLPLMFMLSGRISFSGLNVSILLACVVSMLINIFYSILPQNPDNVMYQIHLAGISLECSITFLLIWNLSTHRTLRKIILAVGVFTAVSLTFIFLGIGSVTLEIKHSLSLAYAGLTLLAAVAIMHQAASDMEGFITRHPSFWTGAGIVFYHGLMSMILLVIPTSDIKEWAANPGFSLLFTISHSIRYVLFAVAVHSSGKQNILREPWA